MESAKFRALLYADIFDYPLTTDELEKWKINNNSELRIKNSELARRDGFYYLRGREQIIRLRKSRKRISKRKIIIAQKAVSLLKKIPFVKLVAITGNLAMDNSQKGDDIDFLLIAQKGTLWLTRLLCNIILEQKGWRRRPKDKMVKNKICLNMFLEDGYLALPKDEQDLYGAHEVCQVKPLFERDSTYQRFLKANSWARRFLPKAIIGIGKQESGIRGDQEKPLFIIHYSLFILERLAKFLQLWYMKQHRTTEIITPHMLRFHPKDYRSFVLQEYERRLAKYEKG